MRRSGGGGSGEMPPPVADPSLVDSLVERGLTAFLESLDDDAPVASVVALADVTGPDAAALVAGLELADLDDLALGDALRATERVMAWAASVQARVVQEMHARAGSRHEWVRDEVAALLTLTGRGAQVLTERATVLEHVPELHDALADGRVDTRRVDTVVRTAAHLSIERTRDVVLEVLPRAEQMTGPRLRDAMRQVEATQDPAAAEKRAVAARSERCVRMEPAPDAMAWITALLPAADAMSVWTAVDALAQQPDGADDGRTLDQRRADALSSVMRTVLERGAAPDGSPVGTAKGRRPQVSVIADPAVLVPGAVGTATLEGYGPIPASVARQVAAEADWRAVGVDPLTGEAAGISSGCYRPSERLAAIVAARDVTCTFPGCRRPAVRCDLDHIEPFDPSRPAAEQTCYVNLHALCRRHHRLKTHGRWPVERDPDTGRTTWRSPAGHVHTRDPVPLRPEVRGPVEPDDPATDDPATDDPASGDPPPF